MDMTTLLILLGIAFAIIVFSYFYSIRGIKRQEKKELDKDIGGTMAKHQILANPALIVSIVGLLAALSFLVITFFV